MLWAEEIRLIFQDTEFLCSIFSGYIDYVSFLQHIAYFVRLYKAMLDSDDTHLKQLEEARQLIRKQLQLSQRSNSRGKFKK